MSRGNRGFLAGLALVAFAVLLLGGTAGAQLVISDPAGGVDNLAPRPVETVTADTVVGGIQDLEVTWTLSPSDVVGQVPTGSDMTQGGTFVNGKDVIGYHVWRIDSTAEPPDTTLIGTVGAGVSSFSDDRNPVLARDRVLVYLVTPFDAAGNENIAGATPSAGVAVPAAPPAQLTVSPALGLNFIAAEVSTPKTMTLSLTNTGVADLAGSITFAGDPVYTLSDTALYLGMGETLGLQVTFAPTDTFVVYGGIITMATNDPDRPSVQARVIGTGVPDGWLMNLPGDFNIDGVVDLDDFFMFADQFGTTRTSTSPLWIEMFDLQPNHRVDFDDFFVFVQYFGSRL